MLFCQRCVRGGSGVLGGGACGVCPWRPLPLGRSVHLSTGAARCCVVVLPVVCFLFLFVQWWSVLILCLRSGGSSRASGLGRVCVLGVVALVRVPLVQCACGSTLLLGSSDGVVVVCCVLVSRCVGGVVSRRTARGAGGVADGVLTGVHRACVRCRCAGHAASEHPTAA